MALDIDWAEHGLKKLLPRQQLWLEHYVVTMNARKSAKLAGYSHPDSGKKMLKAKRAYVDIAVAKYSAPKEEVLNRNSTLLRFDPLKYVNRDGSFNIDMIRDDGFGWMVKDYEVTEKRDARGNLNTITKVKFYDAQKALENQMKILGMFAPDKLKVDFANMSDDELRQIRDGKYK